MTQTPYFDKQVSKLKEAIYGLKHVFKAWFDK